MTIITKFATAYAQLLKAFFSDEILDDFASDKKLKTVLTFRRALCDRQNVSQSDFRNYTDIAHL